MIVENASHPSIHITDISTNPQQYSTIMSSTLSAVGFRQKHCRYYILAETFGETPEIRNSTQEFRSEATNLAPLSILQPRLHPPFHKEKTFGETPEVRNVTQEFRSEAKMM